MKEPKYHITVQVATILLVLTISTSARIINIPADYPSIQQGINAANEGDTVLVQPGTYYENIDFNGHNIVLGSLFLTTADTASISNTIVDGDSVGSVVIFDSGEDSTTIIIGFTIRNGYAAYGGGISCYASEPIISNNIISNNFASSGGGGIDCYFSQPAILRNIIAENRGVYQGGGIYCNGANPRIKGNTIERNQAYDGAGIYCRIDAEPLIDENIIADNIGVGIECFRSEPAITNNHIRSNIGSGVLLNNCSPVIESNCISSNLGNGISLERSNAIIFNNIISANAYDDYGGGIYCYYSNPAIRNNTISRNFYEQGGGIYCSISNPTIINNIIWANGAAIYRDAAAAPVVTYCDIQGGFQGEGNIDTNPLFIYPLSDDYNICSVSPCIDSGSPEFIDPDGSRSDIGYYYHEHPQCFEGNTWHVSVTGNDTTGDGSPSNPYRTIQKGIGNAVHGDTVKIQTGTYVENIDLLGKLILLTSNYLFSYDSLDIHNTIIDGDSTSSVVTMTGGEDSLTSIIGFTIKNGAEAGIRCSRSRPNIKHNIITLNYGGKGGGICCISSNPIISFNIISENSSIGSFAYGAGIYLDNSDALVTNNIIRNNQALSYYGGWGGGICCTRSSPIIKNNVIIGNSAHGTRQNPPGGGGGIWCTNTSNPIICNNTLSENTADVGGALYISTQIETIIINTIFWRDTAFIHHNEVYYNSASPSISYCNIRGGWPGQGNININPLFRNPDIDDYHLMAIECMDSLDSPCIDAGQPDSIDAYLDCSWGLGTNRCDMGAFGGGDSIITDIDYIERPISNTSLMAYNYPNPFNTGTRINYYLPDAACVQIEIYDILGRKVETLIDSRQPGGFHQVIWESVNYPSGIYLYVIKSDKLLCVNKCLLLK